MESDRLMLSVDTSAISVLFLVATLGCLYGHNKVQPGPSYVMVCSLLKGLTKYCDITGISCMPSQNLVFFLGYHQFFSVKHNIFC